LSTQLAVASHDDVSEVAAQLGTVPAPLSTRLPQHTEPVGHWLAPVLPPQSVAYVPDGQVAAHVAE
jgi:hypothetical protein